MKTTTVAAVLASAAGANAQWFGQAPECAQSCLKSQWSTATSGWPAPTEYCGAGQVAPAASCISSACAATPTAITSYSSLSSSLCEKISSCSKAGSTGVMTLTAPAFTGTGFPGFAGGRGGAGGGPFGGGGGPHGGPFGGAGGHGPWGADGITRTWTGGVYTVTGCAFAGSPWAGGPDGWNGGLGGSPWGNWGAGWKWSTATKTITQVLTITEAGSTRVTTSVGLATVAQAVNGEITQVSVIAQAQETGNAAASIKGVKAMGVVLGGVVAVAGLL